MRLGATRINSLAGLNLVSYFQADSLHPTHCDCNNLALHDSCTVELIDHRVAERAFSDKDRNTKFSN